jgi:hypothetical protein
MGAVTKAVNKIIPKEIRPILPFAASMFGGPLVGAGLGKLGVGSKFLGSAIGKGLTGGITNIAAQALTGDKISPRSAILSGLMSGGGSFLRSPGGLASTKFGQSLAPNTLEALQGVGQVLDPAEITSEGYTLTGTGEGLSPLTRPGTAALTVGGAEAAYQTAEEEQRKFEEEQAASEASQRADMASRAEYLRNYAELAGYSQEEINDLLDRYGYSGYRMGGRVGFEIGGMSDVGKLFSKVTGKKPTEESLMDLKSRYAKEIENQMIGELEDDYPPMETLIQIRNEANRQADMALNDYMKSLGMDPFNPPEGSMEDEMINQIMNPRKEGLIREDGENQTPGQEVLKRLKDFDVLPPMDDMGYMDETMQRLLNSRKGKADGGLMNLKMGGMPAEMDLRGGGFVPLGAKERADDVPARLSKNEFVMTADAVRAAGGGSVNKGAKRMYDLMNKLEARV